MTLYHRIKEKKQYNPAPSPPYKGHPNLRYIYDSPMRTFPRNNRRN